MTRVNMLCIGSATQDVFLLGGKIFKPKTEHGEAFEHLPLGAKLELEKVVFATGGDAMNAATTFARQGLRSQFMGIVGNDLAGQAVMQVFDDEGIDTQHARQSDKYQTNYSTILLAPNGERTILVYHGSHLRTDGSDITLSAIDDADWLYVSSVGSIELLHKIFVRAAEHKVKIAFNPAARELDQAEKLRPLLDHVTALITNKQEMQQLVEGVSMEELLRHAAALVPYVVISDGPHGVVATDGVDLVKAGVYEDVKVIDRLGAGDAFGSGFVAMIAGGATLQDAVTFASANATSVVQHIGAKEGILRQGVELHKMPMHTEKL